MADILEIRLHRKPIETLTNFPGDRSLFSFNDDYINDYDRDTLSVSFFDDLGELKTRLRPTQTRIIPFLANLLPEGPMRDYLARRASVHPRREFYILWALGTDLPGAISTESISIQPTLPGLDEANQDEDVRKSERPNALRFSLAGVQLKFSAVAEASGGLTIPVDGVGGSWIVKLPSTRFEGVPENEFTVMSLAKKVGIDVPEIALVPINALQGLPDGIDTVGSNALAIKRFDRQEDGDAVHIEDFAQVFSVYPERKYEKANYRNIAEVIWREVGAQGISEFIRRLVFNALIGNADMHLKNWSLIYPDRRTPALAPAYDLLSTVALLPDNNMALNVARTRRFDEFNLDELAYLAAKARLPRKLVLDTARETVERFMEIWSAEKAHLSLTAESVARIDRHIATMPLVSET
jgi:serine/threonine-protein kinase HipA